MIAFRSRACHLSIPVDVLLSANKSASTRHTSIALSLLPRLEFRQPLGAGLQKLQATS